MVERIKNVASSSIKKVKAVNWKEKKTRRILIITGAVVLVLILAGSGYAIYRGTKTHRPLRQHR